MRRKPNLCSFTCGPHSPFPLPRGKTSLLRHAFHAKPSSVRPRDMTQDRGQLNGAEFQSERPITRPVTTVVNLGTNPFMLVTTEIIARHSPGGRILSSPILYCSRASNSKSHAACFGRCNVFILLTASRQGQPCSLPALGRPAEDKTGHALVVSVAAE